MGPMLTWFSCNFITKCNQKANIGDDQGGVRGEVTAAGQVVSAQGKGGQSGEIPMTFVNRICRL